MKRFIGMFTLVAFTMAVTGCASIVSKSEYPVTISSNPSSAQITVVNKTGQTIHTGTTPTTVTLRAGAGYFSGQDYTVTFKNNGYETKTVQILRGVDGWYVLGNIVFGGLIGWLIVDPATGAMWTLSDLHVDLGDQVSTQEEGMRIATIDDIPEDLRAKLVRIK